MSAADLFLSLVCGGELVNFEARHEEHNCAVHVRGIATTSTLLTRRDFDQIVQVMSPHLTVVVDDQHH
jgi:hypothetical protein